ncbi:MAG: hypothetical protein ACQEV7_04605 [Bacillota bacterium]
MKNKEAERIMELLLELNKNRELFVKDVHEGFAEVSERFTQIEGKIDLIEDALEIVKGKLDTNKN